MNSVSSIDPGFSPMDYSSLLKAAAGTTSFSSVLSQAMKAASNPQERAQVAFAQTQFSNLNTLFAMADPTTSYSSGSALTGMASLFGNGGLFSLPSWASDVERLLGPDSLASQAISIDRQASIASQTLMNNALNSFGSGVDSLF
jgi:hypothetical protein